jgi:radical SAM protein with 4Fe4S-binding SPASM domain
VTSSSARPLLHSVMRRAADNLIPLQVSLEVTHRCNLSCKHCYIDAPLQDELSLDEFKDVLDQLAAAHTMYLLFTGGEILVRPDFFEIAFYAKEHGFIIMLLTNGTMVNPGTAREIQQLQPMSVGISLHGAISATHDGITGKSGSFAATLEAVKQLKSLGVTVMLHTLLMDSNAHEADAMRNLAQSLGVYLRVGHQFVPRRSGSIAPFRYEANLTQLCGYFEESRAKGSLETSGINGVCKAGKGACSISPTGDVFPCLLMPLKLGNLRETRFADIWKDNPGPQLTRLRSITKDDLSTCKDCKLARFCQRCIGVAYTETGELTRPAPSACRNAALKAEFIRKRG